MRALLNRTSLILICITALLQGCGGGETGSLFGEAPNISNSTELNFLSASNDPLQKRITSGTGSGNAGQIVGAVIGIFEDMSLAYDTDPQTLSDPLLRQPTLSGILNWLLINLNDLSINWTSHNSSTTLACSPTGGSGSVNITWNDNDPLLSLSPTDSFDFEINDCAFGDSGQIISGNLSARNFSSTISGSTTVLQASFSLADLTVTANEETITFETNDTDISSKEVFLLARNSGDGSETNFTLTLDAASTSELIINREINNASATGGFSTTTDIIKNPSSAGSAEIRTSMNNGRTSRSLSMNAEIYLDTTEGTVSVETITPLLWENSLAAPSTGIFKITAEAQTSVTVNVDVDSPSLSINTDGIGTDDEFITEACSGSPATWSNLKIWAIVISNCTSSL